MRKLFTIPALALGGALLLAGCGGGGDSGPTEAEIEAMQQAAAIAAAEKAAADAIDVAHMAALALGASSDQDAVNNVNALITAARALIAGLPEGAEAPDASGLTIAMALAASQQRAIDAEAARAAAEQKVKDAENEQARREAEAEQQRLAEEAERLKQEAARMAVQAARYFDGIAPQNGSPTDVAAGIALSAGERAAAYNNEIAATADTPLIAADTRIRVGIGTDPVVVLSEDKDEIIAALSGWEGKHYLAEPEDDGMYEAVVYSNVGMPTMGDRFGQVGVGTPADGYEYGLNEDGEHVVDTTTSTDVQMRVASPQFDQTAGVKTFAKGENLERVVISGSYHGVSGTYYCAPTGDTICASRVAADGFQLGTVASATDSAFTAGATGWNFKPSDPGARVTSMPDSIYASYGVWMHTSEDGSTITGSAFVDVRGGVGANGLPAAAALDSLHGTASYEGGAAGLYALSDSHGAGNDSGHFIADATLDADFSENSITGMIDNFKVGDDEMARDWSVELKEGAIAAIGGITRTGADQTNNDTVWTIGGNAAAASGEWSGTLYDNDDAGVPKVVTGTFYSTYGNTGKMVGAFGANQQ